MSKEVSKSSKVYSKIDQFFLEERNPYSKRRPIKVRNLVFFLVILFLVLVISIFTLGNDGREFEVTKNKVSFQSSDSVTVSGTNHSIALSTTGPVDVRESGRFRGGESVYRNYGSFGASMSTSTRSITSRNSNQVIKRGVGGNDPTAAIPMGEVVPVKLLNSLYSTDSDSPVIAEVAEDVFVHGVLSIPQGSRAIGNARLKEGADRIYLRFDTLVFPDGQQHSLQAMGMMPDGSSGLIGDFQSGEGKRQVGRFLGYFVSGMADGMKERRVGSPLTSPFEPGSVKNGLLNGVTLSAADQAKAFSSGLAGSKASMTIPAGQNFLLFLEREFTP